MKHYYADQTNHIQLQVGEKIVLESLREAVVPPYLMLMPFVELPDGVILDEQLALDEDGVHGCTYILEGTAPCEGALSIGFRDMQSREITHQKEITIQVIE